VEIAVERAEAQLDALIERRALEAEVANREASAWADSVQRYSLRGAAERRRAWAEYHRHRIALFEDLAEHHREMLGRLVDGAAVR
jgi:hypothetical protein